MTTNPLRFGLAQMGVEGCKRALKACLETPEKIAVGGSVIDGTRH